MSTKTQMKPLPKWFNGQIYDKGGTVENIFTGEPAELNANELSMYDFIMGATMVLERGDYKPVWKTRYGKLASEHRKGLDWFRVANPSAYMVLLD